MQRHRRPSHNTDVARVLSAYIRPTVAKYTGGPFENRGFPLPDLHVCVVSSQPARGSAASVSLWPEPPRATSASRRTTSRHTPAATVSRSYCKRARIATASMQVVLESNKNNNNSAKNSNSKKYNNK